MTTTLHILSAGAAKGLVQAMQPTLATRGAASEVHFESQFGAVGAMRDKLVAGEPCDLVILSAALIESLASEGRADRATIASIGDVATGIAVPSGAKAPDVGDARGLSAALLESSAIYLPDPEKATAGIHFANVLRKLGIYEEVRHRLRPFPNGATAMRAMADAGDAAAIGCTQVTEINYTEGVTLAGVLPAAHALTTTYSLAIPLSARERQTAQAFADLLTGADSVELRRRGGFIVAA